MRDKQGWRIASLTALMLGSVAPRALAQLGSSYPVPLGTVIVPPSSIARPGDAGVRAHTNIRLLMLRGPMRTGDQPPGGPWETPASLACVYGLTPRVEHCNPEKLTTVATGGSRAIAIVDAFDYPTAAEDLGTYSATYGLPPVMTSNFQVVYAAGKQPKQDPTGGWEFEECLDIEMAHALAPGAKVILVEAASNTLKDLLQAETVAAQLVAAAGGGEVSNSWGGDEFYNEERTEHVFAARGVVFFASAGDYAGTEYPSALSNVVSVGGTDIERAANGDYQVQQAWSLTGGGYAEYVLRPHYQDGIENVVSWHRGIPDISFNSEGVPAGIAETPNVWIFHSSGGQAYWTIIGGTSVGSPASAAIVNAAGNFYKSSHQELAHIYAATKPMRAFTDIVDGFCGANEATTYAEPGWDFCTGVGTSLGLLDK